MFKTDRDIAAAKHDPDGPREQLIWHESEQGLGVRIGKKAKTFVWQGRIKGKRSDDRLKIGRFGDIKVKEARDLCAAMRAQANAGQHPNPTATPSTPEDEKTLQQLHDDWERTQQPAASTRYESQRLLNQHVPNWLGQPYRSLKKKDILEGFLAIENRDQAQKCFSHIRSLLRFAQDLSDEDDPYAAPTVVLTTRKHRKRPLMAKPKAKAVPRYPDEDLKRLGDELNHWGDERLIQRAAIGFLLFSGMRLGQTLALRCDDIHEEHVLFRPENNRKTHRQFQLPITRQLRTVLDWSSPWSNESRWLFPGRAGQHLDTRSLLPTVRRAGKLTWLKRSDERPYNPAHRFRHTFIQIGSDPEELGGLEIHPYRVGAAVDHVEEDQIMTTKVYSASDALEKKLHTAQQIADRIELLTGRIR